MDAELNTNAGFFGSNLIGYPHIQEGGGNYNGTFKITDESPTSKYKHLPTDDLSQIWATNYRDNIDDLDAQLREADINAFDPEYYGVKATNFTVPASTDMWDFNNFLRPTDAKDGFSGDLPRKHIEGFSFSEDPNNSGPLDIFIWLLIIIMAPVVVYFLVIGVGAFIEVMLSAQPSPLAQPSPSAQPNPPAQPSPSAQPI